MHATDELSIHMYGGGGFHNSSFVQAFVSVFLFPFASPFIFYPAVCL